MKKKYMKQPVPAPQVCHFPSGAFFNSEAETYFRNRRERRKKIAGWVRSGFAGLGYALCGLGIAMAMLVLGNGIRLSILDILANNPRPVTRQLVEEWLASDLRPTTISFERTIHATNCPLATPAAPIFNGIPIEQPLILGATNIVVTNSQIIWYTNYHNGHGIYIGQ